MVVGIPGPMYLWYQVPSGGGYMERGRVCPGGGFVQGVDMGTNPLPLLVTP